MLAVQRLTLLLCLRGSRSSQGRKSHARPVFTSQKILENFSQTFNNDVNNQLGALLIKLLAVFVVVWVAETLPLGKTKIFIENI